MNILDLFRSRPSVRAVAAEEVALVPSYQQMDPLGLFDDRLLTADQFRRHYHSTIAQLLRFRAENIAPHLTALSVQRHQDEWVTLERDDPSPWPLMLRRPSPHQAPLLLWQWAIQNLDGRGFADFLVVSEPRSLLGHRTALPRFLLPVWPEFGTMQPHLSNDGGTAGWAFFGADGKVDHLGSHDVLRIMRPHPTAPWRAAGLLESAAYEADQDHAANIYGRDRMVDQGLPDVVLETDKTFDASQRGDVIRLAREFAQLYRIGRRRGVPVSHGGLKVKPLNLSQRESQFVEQRQFLKSVLYALFSVHEGLFAKDATRANAEAAIFSFATLSVKPTLDLVCSQLAFGLEGIFGAAPDALRIVVPNPVPKDEKQQAEIDQIKIMSGVKSPNQVRQREGDEPVAGGDRLFVPGVLVPLDQVASSRGEGDEADL